MLRFAASRAETVIDPAMPVFEAVLSRQRRIGVGKKVLTYALVLTRWLKRIRTKETTRKIKPAGQVTSGYEVEAS